MAGLHLPTENARAGLLLGIEANGRAGERHHVRRDAALLDDRTALGEIAPQHGEAAVLRVGGFKRANHVVVANLRRRNLFPERLAGNGRRGEVEQVLRKAFENRHDPARAVEVGNVVVSARRELADVRRSGGNLVHSLQRVVDVRFARDGKRVEDGVRAAAHRHVERERVVEGFPRHEIARQRAAAQGHFHGAERGRAPEVFTARIGGEHRTVAGQGEAERLVEAVHRIGREHSAARTAAGAGRLLHLFQLFRRDLAHVLGADGLEDGVEVGITAGDGVAPRRHRAAGGENRRYVDAQGAQQHAGDDLVAVRDADQRVEAVRPRHGLHAVGNQLAARQRILHPGMCHRDAVAHGDRVELHRDAARLDHALLDPFADLVQMAVAGNERFVAVADADERLFHVRARHARREQQTPVRCAFLARLHLIGNHLLHASSVLLLVHSYLKSICSISRT